MMAPWNASARIRNLKIKTMNLNINNLMVGFTRRKFAPTIITK